MSALPVDGLLLVDAMPILVPVHLQVNSLSSLSTTPVHDVEYIKALHEQFGHANIGDINRLLKRLGVQVHLPKQSIISSCDSCHQTKVSNKPINSGVLIGIHSLITIVDM